MRRLLTARDRQHGFFEVRFGIGYIADVRGGDAIDAAHVLQRAFLVDNEKMWRGLRMIQPADSPGGIEQNGCG